MRSAILVVSILIPVALLAADQSISVDLDGDGRADVVRLETTADHVRVTVAATSTKSTVHVDFAPPGRQQQDSVCKYPVKLVAEKLDGCDIDGETLPGCRNSQSKWEVALEDGDCDSIRVYWDHDRKALGWWRR